MIIGPGDSEWYTIENTHVPKFRTLVLKTFGLDIHKNEGFWFSDVDFCLENQIPVKKFIQKPGDLVYLNAGCLHWVRSKGVSVNSAWNIALKTHDVFNEMFKRLDINNEVGFKSIIPLKTLTFQLLKQEFLSLDNELLSFCVKKVKNFVQDEVLQKKYGKFVKEPHDSNVLFCDLCGQETFNYWIHCKNNICIAKYGSFYCLNCQIIHEKNCKNSALLDFYQKYDENELQNFIFDMDEFLKTGIIQKKIEKNNEKIQENGEEIYRIRKKSNETSEDSVKTHRQILRSLYEKNDDIHEDDLESQEKPNNILLKLISFNK